MDGSSCAASIIACYFSDFKQDQPALTEVRQACGTPLTQLCTGMLRYPSGVIGFRRRPQRLADTFTLLGQSSAVANIVMQLSLPPVGEGVSESRVVSGSPRRRPIKRGRTTLQYLALAVMGTEEDRAAMRQAVAEVHRAVVSTSDSPVRYSGNARDLQLWVAVCLFRYYLDQYTFEFGPLTEPELDTLVRAGEPLATGVQVPPGDWPASWAEYRTYWDAMLPKLSISADVHRDFESLADLSFLAESWGVVGRFVSAVLGRPYHWFTRANLPQHFRDLMGWSWTAKDQKRFVRILWLLRQVDRFINPWSTRIIYRLYIWDFRLRRRRGRPVLGRLTLSDAMIRDGGGSRRTIKH